MKHIDKYGGNLCAGLRIRINLGVPGSDWSEKLDPEPHIKVKIQELCRLKIEPRSAMEAIMEAWRLKMKPWRVWRLVVTDWHHFDKTQDPDPHSNEKSDPDQH